MLKYEIVFVSEIFTFCCQSCKQLYVYWRVAKNYIRLLAFYVCWRSIIRLRVTDFERFYVCWRYTPPPPPPQFFFLHFLFFCILYFFYYYYYFFFLSFFFFFLFFIIIILFYFFFNINFYFFFFFSSSFFACQLRAQSCTLMIIPLTHYDNFATHVFQV